MCAFFCFKITEWFLFYSRDFKLECSMKFKARWKNESKNIGWLHLIECKGRGLYLSKSFQTSFIGKKQALWECYSCSVLDIYFMRRWRSLHLHELKWIFIPGERILQHFVYMRLKKFEMNFLQNILWSVKVNKIGPRGAAPNTDLKWTCSMAAWEHPHCCSSLSGLWCVLSVIIHSVRTEWNQAP